MMYNRVKAFFEVAINFLNPFILLKVRKFQNEFMKSSFLPQYEQKIVRIPVLTTQGRNPTYITYLTDMFDVEN